MTDSSTENSPDLKELKIQIEKLNHLLYKRTSPRHLFFYAIVQGIGSIIGATIFAGILIALLSQVLMSVDYIPVLNQFINSEQIQETIIPDN